MAAEAVLKIREAEDKGNESIKAATERAKQIIQKAESDGLKKQKEIISEASAAKAAMIKEARSKATESCADLIKQSKRDTDKILNPDKAKFEGAAKLVIERIVNLSGDR